MVKALESIRSVIRFDLRRDGDVGRRLGAANVDDLRTIAKRRLPAGVFDYIDGGADGESTLRENALAYERLRFAPRVLRDVGAVDTATTVLGSPLAFPLLLAPTGFTRIAHPEGELAVARSAARAGLPYTLSTLSTRSIEDVRAVSNGRLWFQLYMWRDRRLVADLLDRLEVADYEALVVTVDTAVFGRRERDVRRGFSLPPSIGPGTIVDGLRHPRWTLGLLCNEPIRFANFVGDGGPDGASPVALGDFVDRQFDPTLSWDDIAWLRERWGRPILLKGIQSVADADLARRHGVQAIVLSNHGGRQLDCGVPTLDLVGPVIDAVGGSIEVICDGGVRRGSDIVKAVASGATAAAIGRPYLWALAAAGERGVDLLLSWLRSDVARTMALLGVDRVDGLDGTVLHTPHVTTGDREVR